MAQPLTADDLLPLVAKLSQDEQIKLAQRVLHAAKDPTRDAALYRATPVRRDELSQTEDGLSWDAEGWETDGASR